MTEAIKISEWVDKLCGVLIKMSYLNHQKIEERSKQNPDLQKLDTIQRSVDSLNEIRYEIWNELEELIQKAVRGEYKPQKEVRTYGFDPKNSGDKPDI